MTTMIAPCGLDCAQCDAYIATQNNDDAAREKIAKKWRTDYGAPDIVAANIICDGCMFGGRTIGYCVECKIRACASQRGLKNCAACVDYVCVTLQDFLPGSPKARANLESMRKAI